MFQIAPQNTGDALAAMSPDSVRKLWRRGVDIFEQTEDVFQEFEGGPNSPIETITDTAKGAGMSISFTPRSGFYGEPRLGEELFTDPSHFDKIHIGHDSLSVDYLRWATSYTVRMEEIMGMRGEIVSGNNQEIGKWLGREKAYRLAMCMLHKVNGENFLIAGGRSSVHQLRTGDGISIDELVSMGAYAKPMGGAPAMVSMDENKNPVWGNLVVANTCGITGLKLSADWKQTIRESDVRGAGNLRFKGGLRNLDGNLIREWQDIDHDGDGAVGTPFNPKAYLGVAFDGTTAGTASVVLTGGGGLNTAGSYVGGTLTETESGSLSTAHFFKFFPKYQFRFLKADVLSATATTWDLHDVGGNKRFYVAIVNPRNTGSAHDGKFGLYEVNANNGNQLTVIRRLGPAAAGICVTTLGGVTWDANVNTEVHPSGSLMYLATEQGLPLAYAAMILKRGLRRGYGADRNRRGQEGEEDDFVTKVYVRSVFGQAPRKNRAGRVPGVVLLKYVPTYEGWNIPEWAGS